MRARFFALVGEQRYPLKVRHLLHPSGLLPWPRALIIAPEGDGDGSALLLRYAAAGEFGGDTWHATFAGAKKQATSEYGESLGEWRPIPEDVAAEEDAVVAFALSHASSEGDD